MGSVRVIISGYVQGVGFRHFVRREAQRLGLAGWVRNTADNKVEAVFQGEKDKIEEMIKLCKKGPFLSEVKNVILQEEEADENLESFEIRFD